MKRIEMLIEAEQFRDYGGWTLESQFYDEMGSAYLLANGIGIPVEDAVTEIEIPEAGEYRVWVRTKDWVPNAHPGTFQVLINDVPLDRTFGADGKGWSWELVEHVDLPAGSVRLALHDLTGFAGRCDAIYITNTTIAPIDKPDPAGRRWRKRLLGYPEEPEDAGEYDVVVVGGGIAGCCAAYTAAKAGCRVALLHEMEYLGGNASAEVGLTPEGLRGETVDLLSERLEDGDIAAKRILTEMDGCDVLLSRHVIDVHCEDKKITSVDAVDLKSGREYRYRGKQFIDCSGSAILAVLSGAATLFGQESSSDFGEAHAPKKADAMHHGDTVLFRTEEQDEPVDFPEVPWAVRVAKDFSDLNGQTGRVTCLCGRGPYENQPGPYVGPKKIVPFKKKDGSWEHALNLPKSHFWEYGQWLDPYMSKEEIRDHLFCAIIGTYVNVRTKAPEKYRNLKLVHLGNVLATGAFRNYVGDYILSENDVLEHREYPDSIVSNTGAFCLHYPGNPKYDFRLGNWLWLERDYMPYNIPFRSLYSADIDNLLCAGKHISATHVVSSNVKLMGNAGHHGVAVGLGAALCVKYGISPRTLGKEHMAEFKQEAERLGERTDIKEKIPGR